LTKHSLNEACELIEKIQVQVGSGHEHYSPSGELAVLDGAR